MKNKDKKEAFILEWMISRDSGVDVLNASFVDDYIEEFNVTFRETFYGAYKCPELGKILSDMYKSGKVKRLTAGINGMSGLGYPKWVYHYYLR